MRKYNVYDKDDQFLGTINGNSAEEALEEAKIFGMPTADYAKPKEDYFIKGLYKNENKTDLH